jgi:hypothetical protein
MEVRVYKYKKIAYLPINKNASSTFSAVFSEINGWETSQLDLLDDSYKIFAHFQDPIERHYKGTAQFLKINNLCHLINDLNWQKVWVSAVMDRHSYPIVTSLGIRADKIHWIPIHRKIPTNLLTHKYLMASDIDAGIINCKWMNESNLENKQIILKLQLLHETIDPGNHLCFFYDTDIILWNKIIPYTDEDGIIYNIN